MTVHVDLASRDASARRSKALAPTCRGMNYYSLDPSLRDLLPHYMEAPLLAHLAPYLTELGELAGGRLHDLSDQAERHQPVLHPRDGYGRDEEWVEYHPAYREMESIAFGKFGMHAMCNRAGVMGWPSPMPPIAKYVFHYLFAQAEFGLLCPVNLTDSSSELVRRFGTDELRERYLDQMWSQDPATLFKCAQFMTEKAGAPTSAPPSSRLCAMASTGSCGARSGSAPTSMRSSPCCSRGPRAQQVEDAASACS